jgi:anti-sigma28 factor (negative regulator of flagellin synthesis)
MVEHFRQERLEHLRKSIDEGTYHVNDRNVAAAIVRRGIADVISKSKTRG